MLSIVFIIIAALYIFKNGVTFNKFVLFSFIVIMAIPKVNIIGGGSQVTTAGIRLDDLLILVLLVATLLRYRGQLNGNINALIILFALFVFNGSISAIYAWFRGESASVLLGLLTVLRYFEYFCFAIVASKLTHNNSFKKTFMGSLRMLLVFLSIVAVLQRFGLANYYVGGHAAGYFFQGLAVATFNGYYEYGCFCVLMTYFFLASEKKIDYLFAALAFSQVLLTGSRTSLLVTIVVVMIFLFSKCFWCESLKVQKRYITISVSLLTLGVIFIIVASTTGMLERFASFDPFITISQFRVEWQNRDFDYYVYSIRNNIDIQSLASSTGDLSFNIRLFKWAAALDGFTRHPLFGYGAGVTQTMDGNYIKLLCEQGIFGFVLWFIILFSMLSRIKTKKNYMIGFVGILLISSLTIDMFEASKIMEFIWFMGGMMLAQNNVMLYKEKETKAEAMEVSYVR